MALANLANVSTFYVSLMTARIPLCQLTLQLLPQVVCSMLIKLSYCSLRIDAGSSLSSEALCRLLRPRKYAYIPGNFFVLMLSSSQRMSITMVSRLMLNLHELTNASSYPTTGDQLTDINFATQTRITAVELDTISGNHRLCPGWKVSKQGEDTINKFLKSCRQVNCKGNRGVSVDTTDCSIYCAPSCHLFNLEGSFQFIVLRICQASPMPFQVECVWRRLSLFSVKKRKRVSLALTIHESW